MDPSKRNQILKRLSNLQDLIARPSTPDGERESALLRVREILQKYQLSESDIPTENMNVELVWTLSKSSYKWEQQLAVGLGQIFGYRVYTRSGINQVIVACKSGEADIHSQIFYSMKNQILYKAQVSWDELHHLTRARKNKRTFSREFCTSASSSFLWKLKMQKDKPEDYIEDDSEETLTTIVISNSVVEKLDELASWMSDNPTYKVVSSKPKNSKERATDTIAQYLGSSAGLDLEIQKGLKS